MFQQHVMNGIIDERNNIKLAHIWFWSVRM